MAWIKLEHLQQFAEKFSAKASGIFARKEDIPKSLPADGGDASTVNGHTVNEDVPEGAKFTDTNTTYSVMKAASASEAGSAGLVPAPEAGKQNAFLKGDGTWEEMADVTDADIDDIIAGTFE